MDFDKSLVDEFVIEAKEHLESVEQHLLALEKEKDKPDQELINTVYRAIHTVKGAAGFLGLKNIGDLSHVMETLLSMMRKGEILPESKFVDALLEGLDYLNTMLDDTANSNNVNIDKIHNRLTTLLAKSVSSEVKKDLNTKISLITEDGEAVDFDIDEFSLKNIGENLPYLYLLQYNLPEFNKKKGKSPVTLVKQLLDRGEIVDSRLDAPADDLSKGLPQSPLMYSVVYSSKLSKSKIPKAVDLPKDRIKQIKKGDVKETKKAEQKKKEETEKLSTTKKEKPLSNATEKTNKTEDTHHETVRISVDILDKLMMLAGEMVLVRNQQLLSFEKSEPIPRSTVQRLNIVTTELQENIMQTRMQPIGNILTKFTRIVRELGKNLGKEIEISIIGNEVELDKTILELLTDPLTHLIRNCCDHAIELPEKRAKAGKPRTGAVTLRAFHENGQINIEIKDDGKGIDTDILKNKAESMGVKTKAELEKMSEKELLSLIFLPGLSTAEKVSNVSGRGVGMDVVKTNIEKLGGIIEIESKMGKGTEIYLRLPLTLAIIPCLIVMVEKNRYAIPQINIEELVCLYDNDVKTKIECAGDREVYRLRDHLLPMVRLSEVLKRSDPFTDNTCSEIAEIYRNKQDSGDTTAASGQSMNFAVLKLGNSRYGLIIDRILGTEEIVVKPMHPALKSLSIYTGATVLGDGGVALILDVLGIARHSHVNLDDHKQDSAYKDLNKKETQDLLLFKSGKKEQFAVALSLIKRIERISCNQIERIGGKEFITVDGASTLVLRLDQHLNVSKAPEKESMYLLLPKYSSKRFGILMSDLINIGAYSLEINTDSYMEKGLLGTSIIDGHMTLLIDIFQLIEKAQPDWFHDRRSQTPLQKKGIRILLVEDHSFFRQLIKTYLEAGGFQITTAEDGREGLKLINNKNFDLIVSDLEMPVMNGWDFMRKVRETGNHKNIPSIALTAVDSEEGRKSAKECGFERYELKLDRERLLTTIAELLQSHRVEAIAA